MRNHTKVDNIEQLISLSNLGRSRFFSKFNEVFGMTAKQWMLKQRTKDTRKMNRTGSMYKDAVEELGFDSQSNFNRHCKLYFGCTAKQLMERCQTENNPIYEDNHATCTK